MGVAEWLPQWRAGRQEWGAHHLDFSNSTHQFHQLNSRTKQSRSLPTWQEEV